MRTLIFPTFLFFVLTSISYGRTLVDELADLKAIKLPSSIEFESKLPAKTVDIKTFRDEESTLNEMVDDHKTSYGEFDLKYIVLANKVKALAETLQGIQKIRALSSTSDDVLSEKESLLRKAGLTSEEQLREISIELQALVEQRNHNSKDFELSVAKARSSIRSEITNEQLLNILNNIGNDFVNCDVTPITYDEDSGYITLDVKTNYTKEPKRFVVSKRLPVVLQLTDDGLIIQFKRDSEFNRGNLSIGDAVFVDETTEMKLRFNDDGSSRSLFFYSLGELPKHEKPGFWRKVMMKLFFTGPSAVDYTEHRSFISCIEAKEEVKPHSVFVNSGERSAKPGREFKEKDLTGKTSVIEDN